MLGHSPMLIVDGERGCLYMLFALAESVRVVNFLLTRGRRVPAAYIGYVLPEHLWAMASILSCAVRQM